MQYQHHPFRYPPGAVIGYTRSGRPIPYIAGGSEPDPPPPANGGTDPAQPPQPEPPQAQPPATDPAANAGQQGGDGDPASAGTRPPANTVDALPEFAQRIIRDLRSENAATRTRAKQQADALEAFKATHTQQMDGIARALGFKPEEVTPEQLTAARDAASAERDSAIAERNASRVELAAYRAAAAAGADPGKLLDSRAFVQTLTGLDPAADDFAQAVADKVTAALEDNPGWKLSAPPAPGAPPAGQVPPPIQPPQPTAPPVPASGPQGSPGPPPAGPRQLTEADAKNMSPQEVVAAMNAGSFRGEGFGPSRKLAR